MDKTINENAFFHEATLRICSTLEIEKAMFSTLKFLRQAMPVDWMAIEHYDEILNAMRTIAVATSVEGKSVDLLTPLSGDAQHQAKQKYSTEAQKVFLFEDPKKEKLACEMLKFHEIEATSLMVLSLGCGERRIGTLALASYGEKRFSQQHAHLLSMLSEPFAIALSNTLKNRTELILSHRDFFWEVTRRVCGNLEIEQSLHDCLKYISNYMPADFLYLSKYEKDFGTNRLIAHASPEKCKKMDVLLAASEETKEVMSKFFQEWQEGKLPPVLVINRPKEEIVTRSHMEMLGLPSCSTMNLPLVVQDRLVGNLILLAKGDDRFNEQHVKLFATLRMPFFVAMSNTLQHREIVKLKDMLADDNRYLKSELKRIAGDSIIGAKFGLKRVMQKTNKAASVDSPVLLLGETGVGKDVIANEIHYSSFRKDGPFIKVNCGAIPETLLDSELFGHEKGAFTGALTEKRGRFERADKGTILLDEIGELPPQAQVRLLRVLQDKEIERVGGTKTISLDIRIIAATNRNLEDMVKAKQFREDLWFRLNVFPIWIPPLRERRSDIPALLQHFINLKTKQLKLPAIPNLSPGVIDPLLEYHWPGNVRELENVVERTLILNPSGPLSFEHLTQSKQKEISVDQEQMDYELTLDEMTSRYIRKVLSKTNGKIHGKGGAAELLGINANTLRNRMNKLGIDYGKSSR